MSFDRFKDAKWKMKLWSAKSSSVKKLAYEHREQRELWRDMFIYAEKDLVAHWFEILKY